MPRPKSRRWQRLAAGPRRTGNGWPLAHAGGRALPQFARRRLAGRRLSTVGTDVANQARSTLWRRVDTMLGQSIFGVHEQALSLRAHRTEVLATNLANADTPNFKARDFDFSAVLSGAAAGRSPGLQATHARHIQTSSAQRPTLAYRNPFQPSRDGNTVESDLEFARFAENSIAYQATLRFLGGRISTLRMAIGGR